VSDNRRLSGIHVLVVDDNPDAREIFQSVITYMGALVTVAVSAEIALKITRHVRPDVAWLIERLRHTKPERGGDIPAIAVTAYDDEYRKADMLALGFHDYLVKPVGTEQLCQTIERLTILGPPAAPRR